MQDLVVALDNADSRMLYAHFFPQEGTAPTFVAPEWVLRNYGRSPSFTLTAGSDFCHSERPTRGACLPATMPQAGPLHANKVTLPTRRRYCVESRVDAKTLLQCRTQPRLRSRG
jgi:hypothetical protein